MGSNRKRSDEVTADQKLIDGVIKHAATIPSLVVASTTLTTGDIVALLRSRIDRSRAVDLAHASWLTAVKAERDGQAQTRDVASGLRQAIAVAFAGRADALADFGLAPRKPRVISPETQLVAAAKARATRQARHTMGRRQKEKIKGEAPPVILVSG